MMTPSSCASPILEDPADSSGLAPRNTRPYILVVDDEAVVRAFVARCLEGQDYDVRLAEGAADALEIMMSQPAAAVLCDIRMPGRDGFWLVERIHAHWPSVPIVMATGVDDVETIERSRALGAVDYIAKPIAAAQLVGVIRRVTSGSAPEEPVGADETDANPAQSASAHDAEYTLESPVRCPACGERVRTLNAVRLIRARVNFTSTLPRRGRVLVCPHCLAIAPAELTNF
jgi:CheY-like chemotaxis protein